MEIIEKGKKGAKTLLLISGMIVDFEKSFKDLADLLENDYRLLYLKLDGHRGQGEFTSIKDQAKKAVDLINEKYRGKINYALGVSMGANILVEILSIKNDIFDRVVLDAPFLIKIPEIFCRLTAEKQARKFKKIIDEKDFSAINKKFNNMVTFAHKEIDMGAIVDEDLSVESIKNQGYSSFTMELKDSLKLVEINVLMVCGSKEKWALKSYKKLKPYIKNLKLKTFPGHYHATKIKLDVEDYKDSLINFFEEK